MHDSTSSSIASILQFPLMSSDLTVSTFPSFAPYCNSGVSVRMVLFLEAAYSCELKQHISVNTFEIVYEIAIRDLNSNDIVGAWWNTLYTYGEIFREMRQYRFQPTFCWSYSNYRSLLQVTGHDLAKQGDFIWVQYWGAPANIFYWM